jgi:hypothetical protein
MFECCFIIFEECVLTVTNIVLITATLAPNDESCLGKEFRMDGIRKRFQCGVLGDSALELYFSILIFSLPGHVAESIGRIFRVFPSEAP